MEKIIAALFLTSFLGLLVYEAPSLLLSAVISIPLAIAVFWSVGTLFLENK